jgi:toxin-antitoxin system PIN domain toxin
MRLWDVNLWVYAFRGDSPLHARSHALLGESLERREGFIFCPAVALSFLRIVTNPRVFIEPSTPADAWSFVSYLESHTASHFVDADAMTFGVFRHLCLVAQATGNALPDAYLAAIALRRNATLMTADAGMRRFQGVAVEVVA